MGTLDSLVFEDLGVLFGCARPTVRADVLRGAIGIEPAEPECVIVRLGCVHLKAFAGLTRLASTSTRNAAALQSQRSASQRMSFCMTIRA